MEPNTGTPEDLSLVLPSEYVSQNWTSGMRLGEFLVTAGVLSNDTLKDCIRRFYQTRMPLGKMLIFAGHLTPEDLDTAQKLLAVIRLTSLPVAIALHAFDYVRRDELTLVQALRKAGIEGQVVSYSRLGVLLVDAEIITRRQYEEARKSCKRLSTPLGSVLCLMGVINEDLLGYALEVQRQMRSRLISKDEAILRLRHSPAFLLNKLDRSSNGQLFHYWSDSQNREVSTMELLSMCGALSDQHMMAAYSAGCENIAQVHLKIVADGLVQHAVAADDSLPAVRD